MPPNILITTYISTSKHFSLWLDPDPLFRNFNLHEILTFLRIYSALTSRIILTTHCISTIEYKFFTIPCILLRQYSNKSVLKCKYKKYSKELMKLPESDTVPFTCKATALPGIIVTLIVQLFEL